MNRLSILLAAFLAFTLTSRAEEPLRIAGITTVYRYNSHADQFFTRLIETKTLDGKGPKFENLELVSLHVDQFPEDDLSRSFAKKHEFKIYDNITDTLTLGTGELAVDGVLLVAEHGDYPESDTGQFQFPKRRLFAEVVKVFEKSGKVVPVFFDKHLSDNWEDARWIYDEAKRLKIPLMAGSSLPVLWRKPEAELTRGAKVKEMVALSYHRLDSYGFHAVEMVQCLVERRAGGETGVKSVQCLTGDAVWEAGRRGVYDRAMLDAALARMELRKIPEGKTVEDLVRKGPDLFVIDYNDGLRTCVFTLNGAVAEWVAAWREDSDDAIKSTIFFTQEERPYYHFALLLEGIEPMMLSGKPTWPAERTLMTSGILDAALISKRDGGKKLATPWLSKIHYQSEWSWQPPPPPPPDQPRPPRVKKKKK